jgi:glycosyltransferase involved in cell wall biosynthesis
VKKIMDTANLSHLPKISVVTPTYNQAAYIVQCIESVQTQDYPDFEHIVIDGASTDATVEIVKRYEHLIWRSEEDSGQTEALIKGLRMASGEIIAWLNSDDYYPAGALSKVGSYFQEHPDIRILIGDCLFYYEGTTNHLLVHNKPFDFEDLIRYWDAWVPPTQPSVFFRRELIDEFGLLDASLHYAMDYDFWLRVTRKYKIYHIPELLSVYRFHDLSKSGMKGDWSRFYPEWHRVYQKYKHQSGVLPDTPLISVVILAEKGKSDDSLEVVQNVSRLMRKLESQIVQDIEVLIITDYKEKFSIQKSDRFPVNVFYIEALTLSAIRKVVKDHAHSSIVETLPVVKSSPDFGHYAKLINQHFPKTSRSKHLKVHTRKISEEIMSQMLLDSRKGGNKICYSHKNRQRAARMAARFFRTVGSYIQKYIVS